MDYIDTSVLTSYYIPDSGSDMAQQVIERIRNPNISTLTQVEFTCTLARNVRNKTVSKEHAHRIVTLLDEHVRAPYYQLLQFRPKNYVQAQNWLARFNSPLRVLDALHLAVAHEHGCRLLTADRDMAKAARQFKVRCRLIA